MLTRSFLVKEAKLSIGLIKMDVIFFLLFSCKFHLNIEEKNPMHSKEKMDFEAKIDKWSVDKN